MPAARPQTGRWKVGKRRLTGGVVAEETDRIHIDRGAGCVLTTRNTLHGSTTLNGRMVVCVNRASSLMRAYVYKPWDEAGLLASHYDDCRLLLT